MATFNDLIATIFAPDYKLTDNEFAAAVDALFEPKQPNNNE